MSANEREILAGLRILALTAKADGVLRDEERHALEVALGDLRRDGGHPSLPATVEELLGADVSIEVEEEFLRSGDARSRVYDACMALATADGETSPAELAFLERLRPAVSEPTVLSQALAETADTFLPTDLPTIYDPVARDAEVREDILKYAILSAAVGALPVPLVAVAADVAVVGLQMKMVRDVGVRFGHRLDKSAIRSLIGTTAGSIILRVAINNIARFVPGWGSVVGGVTSFASTMALGEVAKAYFEVGGAVTPAELRERYQAAYQTHKGQYTSHSAAVKDAAAVHGAKIKSLADDLAAGRITREDYEREISALR